MLSLKVSIDNQSGFCFGVVYAIQMAEDILKEEGILYCLGDIVHNDEEIARLKKLGLIIINHDYLKDLRNVKVLIRAHGEPPSTYSLAIKNNIQLIDASCPVVLKLQQRVKAAHDRGESIYILGKHGHAEVAGLLGQTNGKATVFEKIDELDFNSLPEKFSLFSQTTKSTALLFDVDTKLKEHGIDVTTNDTICRQVSNRDEQLKRFVVNYDKIIFIAGVKSSNGKVLFNTCSRQNPNSYFISTISEINKNWFKQNETVGICGATSTPMWLMEAVRDELLSY
jgi:4-hydroxy-3-methylbut-2-enyl diphosphate reductase